MRIQYKATKHRMNVNDVTGRRLVAAGIAVEVIDKTAKPEPVAEPEPVKPKPVKPKRTYRRRDMQANPAGYESPASYITRGEEE